MAVVEDVAPAISDVLAEDKTVAEAGKALQALMEQSSLRISEIVDVILRKSVMTDASDVHIEATHQGLRIRYRIDGVFMELGHFPLHIHQQLVARVKVLADLVSHRKEVTQEGRLTVAVEGKRRDFRVSIVPAVAGEKVVMRMFNPQLGLFELDRLGYSPKLIKELERLLFDLSGMVVLTGPAG